MRHQSQTHYVEICQDFCTHPYCNAINIDQDEKCFKQKQQRRKKGMKKKEKCFIPTMHFLVNDTVWAKQKGTVVPDLL
jgi:hypothetical protein